MKFIEAVSRGGRLSLAKGTRSKVIGRKVIVFDEIDSTMDKAKELASNEDEGLVVCAETQTKGRGRFKREWISPKSKGLYFSVVLKPSLPVIKSSFLTFFSSVAICQTLRRFYKCSAQIKWPNDILLNGRKLAGILTEIEIQGDKIGLVVLGVGINVNSSSREIPHTATSLYAELNRCFVKEKLFERVLSGLDFWYLQLLHGEFDALMQEWRRLSATLNSKIKIADQYGIIEGTAVDLDETGAIIIQTKDGGIVKKTSGDLQYIKD